MMIKLGENRYGKSRVRLVRVRRHKDHHQLREWTVQILLQGEFESCFVGGDNSKILPTDTMKNTVYSLARKSEAESIEEFAKELIDFLLSRNSQISSAEVNISEKPWEHMQAGGRAQPTAFVQSRSERLTTTVRRAQKAGFTVASGIQNLVIMKTSNSAFEGFIQDSLTTLPPTPDRLLGTALRALWTYQSSECDFIRLREKVCDTLLSSFAAHDSKSVQHTLYAMAGSVLESLSQVAEIELTMPNIHCLLVDLARFGQDNPNDIFMPIDEPHGYIEARLSRH